MIDTYEYEDMYDNEALGNPITSVYICWAITPRPIRSPSQRSKFKKFSLC